MSYLALARKWRPRRFEDVMGQGHVVKALSHALDGDRLHPAILLTGTRGVGKTTLARIIAKCLNCETGVSANPCGVCSACKEVDDGRFVDLLEIDAASHTGVDDVRQMIDNAQYAPARGRYKVYLIDEVHMLSKSAFNALLKTLEEPPPHLKFILATTDPQKLLVTVLSRCLQFNLKRLPVSVIRDQLALVLGNENIGFEPAAISEIARAADGSMRDGLSLLDQAIAFAGGGTLERQGVEDMLGTSGRESLFVLLRALAAADNAALIGGLAAIEQQAPDYAALLNDLAAHLQRLAVLQLLPSAATDEDDSALIELKDRLKPEDVQLYYQIAVNGRRDLAWAPDPRLGFEMTLLRMAAFRIDDSAGGAGPSAPSGGARSSSVGGAATAPVSAVSRTAVAPAPAVAVAIDTPRVAAVPPPQSQPQPQPLVDDGIDAIHSGGWSELVETLGLESFTRQLARHCGWQGRRDETVQLAIDAKLKHLVSEERRAALERALSAHFGRSLKLRIELTAEELQTPALLAQQKLEARQQDAERRMLADPVVQAFRDQFNATVRPGSIHPLDS